jgi:hypothetical protein
MDSYPKTTLPARCYNFPQGIMTMFQKVIVGMTELSVTGAERRPRWAVIDSDIWLGALLMMLMSERTNLEHERNFY